MYPVDTVDSKAYALPPTLNWGFGLNGLHIESCLVCLAFMVDY